jgi:SAM-dependent methyltransferase
MLKFRPIARSSLRALAFSVLAACAAAPADTPRDYEPEMWQAGKDVVWVPMARERVEKMLDLAKLTPADFVVDLGSGDGVTVIAAARRGARAMGVEFNPDLVAFSRRQAQRAGVAERTQFVQGDLFQADLSRATVITLFLLDEINLKLRPSLLALKPGTRVLSNTFRMGDWEPDATETAHSGCANWCALYLWIVPARVEGAWSSPEGPLVFKQQYQKVGGALGTGALAAPVLNGGLNGDEIRFTAGGADYRGRVKGEAIEGTITTAGGIRLWKATR